jgi:hypothetical protein
MERPILDGAGSHPTSPSPTLMRYWGSLEPTCDLAALGSSEQAGEEISLKDVQPMALRQCLAGMAELADAADSKSAEGNLVGVRPPLPAPR